MIIIIHENSGQKYIAVGPADGAADGVGGEASENYTPLYSRVGEWLGRAFFKDLTLISSSTTYPHYSKF